MAQVYEKDESSSAKPEGGSSGGLFGKLSRWWHGPSSVTVRVPSNPPGQITPARIATPPSPPPGGGSHLQRPFAPPPTFSPAPTTPPITQPTLPSGSGAERVHAALKLEQTERELEEAKRELQLERERAQAKLRDVEKERDQARAELNRFFSGKGESESHINMLRKSVSALERQLQEERETAANNVEDYERKVKALEEALQNARGPQQQLRAEAEEHQVQRERLESLVERYKSEFEAAQRRIPELQEELDAAQVRIGQMESELARKSDVSDTAKMERARIEERAGFVQKALEVMEQQLREEREASGKQIHQLEEERDHARARATQLETRVATLLRDLDSVKDSARAQARSKKKGPAAEPESDEGAPLTTRSEGRIFHLEKELATSVPLGSAEKQATTTRISKLESRWEELKSRLLPKDREITELRQQAEQQRAEIQRLEAALAEAQQQPAAAATSDEAAVAGGLMTLNADTVQTLYNQSMSKLTVLMASADILMMDSKLGPSVKESLQEIKNEGQSLLELIKSYTIPPDAPKSH